MYWFFVYVEVIIKRRQKVILLQKYGEFQYEVDLTTTRKYNSNYYKNIPPKGELYYKVELTTTRKLLQ